MFRREDLMNLRFYKSTEGRSPVRLPAGKCCVLFELHDLEDTVLFQSLWNNYTGLFF
jgi:hypothetical protein